MKFKQKMNLKLFKTLATILVILMSRELFCQVNLNLGLVAHYPFNGNANDMSGNNNNPIINTATLTGDRFGNANSAYRFNGLNNYMQIKNSTSLNTGNKISLCAWVKVSGFYYGQCKANSVLMKGNSDFLPGNYAIRFDDATFNSGTSCSNQFPDTLHQTFRGVCSNNSKEYIVKDKWYFVAYTYENNNCKFYVNCKLQDSVINNGLIFNNADDLFLGRLNNAQYPFWFNGDLDEVRIYDRALNFSEILALNQISTPEFSFSQNICSPKEISFKNESSVSFKNYWLFGNGQKDSINKNPTHSYINYNSYSVSLVASNGFGCFDTVTKKMDINNVLDSSLISNKKDTTICAGTSFILNAKDTGIAYCWSMNNASSIAQKATPTVTPTNSTTYTLTSQTLGNNIVANGDFEQGNTGFTSDYAFQAPPNTLEGVYFISTDPKNWNLGLVSCKDHTSGLGNMMTINGSPSNNLNLWRQKIKVLPNKNYVFSAWLMSANPVNPALLQFSINGTQIGALLQASTQTCIWKRFYVTWNSGTESEIDISIINKNTQILGNDFAIDDISFAELITKTDSIQVSVINCATTQNPDCIGAISTSKSTRITPPTPISKYMSNTGFTWECWFNSSYYNNNSTTVNTRNKLISILDGVNCQDAVLGFGWPQVAQQRELCFVVDGPNGCADRDNNPCKYFPTGGFIPNTWYHVAGVKNNTNGTTSLYVNGVLVDSKSNTKNNLNPTVLPFFGLGSYSFGFIDSSFEGKLDEIRFWNYPRTTNQIADNYNKCLPSIENGLIAYYRCNESTGLNLKDATNQNNASTSSVNRDKSINAPVTSICYQSTYDTLKINICNGQNYLSFNTSGTYNLDTIPNSAGCDSIRILLLNVSTPPITVKDTITNCGAVIINGITYTTNQVVSNTIKSLNGCDSILQQHQIIITKKQSTFSAQICAGKSFWGKTIAGNYDSTFKLANNCDSVVTLTLSVTDFIKDTTQTSICLGSVYRGKNENFIFRDTIKTIGNCDSIKVDILTILPPITSNLPTSASICDKDILKISPGRFKDYLWSTGSTDSSITVKSKGIYWVIITDINNCKLRDTFNLVNVYPLPTNFFIPNKIEVCIGENFTLNGFKDYLWNTTETQPKIALNGLNQYSAIVTDFLGCKGADTLFVTYNNKLVVNIPTAFSPNGDGINDEFIPFNNSSCLQSYNMQIFNRWGQKIFERIDPNKPWKGKSDATGKDVPTDVYFYIINYKNYYWESRYKKWVCNFIEIKM
jgi:gliding motility-associated-like protein